MHQTEVFLTSIIRLAHLDRVNSFPLQIGSAADIAPIMNSLSSTVFKLAGAIKEKIEGLEAELAALLGGSSAPAKAAKEPKAKGPGRPKKAKRTMSPEARQKIADAQKRRWAKQKKAAPKEN